MAGNGTLNKVFCHNWESSSEGLCSYAETLGRSTYIGARDFSDLGLRAPFLQNSKIQKKKITTMAKIG